MKNNEIAFRNNKISPGTEKRLIELVAVCARYQNATIEDIIKELCLKFNVPRIKNMPHSTAMEVVKSMELLAEEFNSMEM